MVVDSNIIEKIIMKPMHFNKVEDASMFMDMCGRFEVETHLCWRLNKHIETNTPFSMAVESSHKHESLVKDGWLIETIGDNAYILSRKALGLLWSVFGK